jgi:V/A-type H+-transporting ATPase subunit I
MRDSFPTLGLLLALLVLLIGHALNFVLSLSSAVIHGLRLNVMEFFNWGLPEEGTPFRTFAKKEPRSWINS